MLRRPPTPDTFFETVSDLMFGTMAIMVMLMCVFMVLDKPKQAGAAPTEAVQSEELPDIKPFKMPAAGRLPEEQDVAALERQFNAVKEELSKVKEQTSKVEQLRALAEGVDRKEVRNVELVVMIDVTGSMQREIDDLRQNIQLLAQTMPRIVGEFRMAVVAHRRDQNDRDVTRVFPMQAIRKEGVDNGASRRQLEAFAAPLAATPGSAPFESAVNQALSQFSPPQFDGQQALMMIGDVGPYEDAYGDQSISGANRASESAIQNAVKQWVDAGVRRRVTYLSGPG